MASFSREQDKRSFAARIPTAALLFCFFLAVYALVIYGQVRYGDEAERYLQAQSLVERISFVIPLVPAGGVTGVGGLPFSQFELGYGLVVVPFYALGRAVSLALSPGNSDWIPILFVSLSNPVITALLGALSYRFSRSLGARRATAIYVAAILGLGTIALPYAKGLYREALQALTLFGAAYGLWAWRRTGQLTWVWLAGFAFGYCAFTKVANLSMLPVLLGYLLFVVYERSAFAKARLISQLDTAVKVFVALLLPVLLLLTVQGCVNALKFGNFFNIGPYNYGNPLPYFSLSNLGAGITGLLFSPTKSLFIFAPPALLFLPAIVAFYRRDRVNAVFLFALVAFNVFFAASYVYWDGGTYWGPRYLVETVPLMVLPLGYLIESSAGAKGRLWRLLVALVFVAGLGVQTVGALVNDREYVDAMQKTIDLAGGADFLRHAAIDTFAFSVSSGGLQIQPYGWALLLLVVPIGVLLVRRATTRQETSDRSWGRLGWGVSITGMLAVAASVIVFLGAPYPAALAAKGDTRFTAGESFGADARYCEAQAMYGEALYFGTNAASQSVARLQEITPTAPGMSIDFNETAAKAAYPNEPYVQRDLKVFLASDSSLKIRVPAERKADIEVDSEFLDIDPNTTYIVSGWVKTEGVKGEGSAVVGWYEDNGKWRQGRNIDLVQVTGTQGWQPFRRILTTQATTQRVLLKAGMWKSVGTVWIDAIQLAEIGQATGPAISLCTRPVPQESK